MLTTIKDYFLNVLVRAIINYVSFAFIMLVILVGYVLITDWATTVKFATDIANNDFTRFVIWLPLFFSLFKADKRGKATGRASRGTTEYYLMTNNSAWL